MLGRVAKVPEVLGEGTPAPVDTALDGADRDTEDLRGRFESEALEIDEDDRAPEFGLDGLQGRLDVGSQLDRGEGVAGGRIRGVVTLGEGVRAAAALSP